MIKKDLMANPAKVYYGSGLVNNGTLVKQLHMLFYKPPNFQASKKYPLIIHTIGRSFTWCNPDDDFGLAFYFSQKGYLVASPNYRLAKDKGLVPDKWNKYSNKNVLVNKELPESESENLSVNMLNAAFTAVRDVKSCIRFLTKNAERFSIDTTKVFLSGQSAGAMIALAIAFGKENSYFKDDPEYVKKDTTLNDNSPDTTPFEIKAYISTSGSTQIAEQHMAVYGYDYTYFEGKLPQLMLIHAVHDPVVLIKHIETLYSTIYASEQMKSKVRLLKITNKNQIDGFYTYLHIPLYPHIEYTYTNPSDNIQRGKPVMSFIEDFIRNILITLAPTTPHVVKTRMFYYKPSPIVLIRKG
jgi:acetyl esterase/lipase